jgi:polysaccharide export outer membrane protein
LRHSFVQRGGQFLPVDFQKLLAEGDMSQNIYLQPDDFIYLPSTLFHEVFVLGNVRFPRTVPYTDRITLMSAIANANGPAPGAYLSHVAVVRGSLSQPKVAVVDYGDIISGKQPDIRLEPHDIVYVPFRPFNGLRAYAGVILSTFVNTVAANEGANFVSDNSDTVGITVGPGGSSSGGGSPTSTSTGGSSGGGSGGK